MIKNIAIKNFKSIAACDLKFGKVNLFIGPNGGGKTNILEAIGLVSSALGRSVSPIDLDSRGVRLSLPRLFKSTFKNKTIPQGFQITTTTDNTEYKFSLIAGDNSKSLVFRHESLKVDNEKLFGRSPHGFRIHKPKKDSVVKNETLPISNNRGGFDLAGSYIDIPHDAESELNKLIMYRIYAPQTAILRGIAIDSRQTEPLGLTGGRLSEALRELFHQKHSRKTLDKYLKIVVESGWASQIRVAVRDPKIVPPEVPTFQYVTYFKDKFMNTKRDYLSAYDASEGTLFILFVATLLAHVDSPHIFALDNIDGTLNPGLVRKLMDYIVEIVMSEADRQVFLTSHNPTALDAIDIFDPDHKAFVVHRNIETGYTEFDLIIPAKGITRDQWITTNEGRNTSAMWLENTIPNALN